MSVAGRRLGIGRVLTVKRLDLLVGTHLRYEQTAPRHRVLDGEVTAWEWAGCTIRAEDGREAPGVRFRIRHTDARGRRRLAWTAAMPAWPIHDEDDPA